MSRFADNEFRREHVAGEGGAGDGDALEEKPHGLAPHVAGIDAHRGERRHGRAGPERVVGPDDAHVLRHAESRLAELQLEALRRRLETEGLRIDFTDAVRDLVAARGYVPAYGARPVKRVVNALVVDALGGALLTGSIDRARPIRADADGESVVFSQSAP